MGKVTRAVIAVFIVFWGVKSLARTGPDLIGNGGDAVVCRDSSTREIVSAETLDLYEARVIRKKSFELDPSLNEESLVDQVLSRLSTLEKVSADSLKVFTDTFMEEAAFFDNVKLKDIKDSHDIITPEGCEIEQVVIQKEPDDFNPNRYTVNNSIWQKFDNISKAAMIMHEAVYRIFIESNMRVKDSRIVRLITSQLLANDLEENIIEFIKNLKRIGLEEFELAQYQGLLMTSISISDENQIESYLAEVINETYEVEISDIKIALKRDDRIRYSRGFSVYTLYFAKERVQGPSITLSGDHILNNQSRALSSFSYQVIPVNEENDEFRDQVEISLEARDENSAEHTLNGINVSHRSRIRFRQDSETKKIIEVSANELKLNEVETCHVLVSLGENYGCIISESRRRNSDLSVVEYDSELVRKVQYSLGRFFKRVSYHQTGHEKSTATKTFERGSTLETLRSVKEMQEFLKQNDGSYSMEPLESAFDAIEKSNDVEMKRASAGSSSKLSEKNVALLPEGYYRRWSGGGYYFEIPYLTTKNRVYYEDGTPRFNININQPSIPGFIKTADGLKDFKIRILNPRNFKDIYDFNPRDIHGFQDAVLPYPEWFPNGKIKYAVVQKSNLILSNLFLHDTDGVLQRLEHNDFLVLNEKGQLVEVYRIDRFLGAIKANEIRKAQVEEYGIH